MDRTIAMRKRAESVSKTPLQPGVQVLPPRGEPTQIQPAVATGMSGMDFARDLAVFTAAMSKRPEHLLATLSGDLAVVAHSKASELKAMASPERRATVARTFAPPADVAKRLRATLMEAGPLLQEEIFRQLPTYLRVDVADIVRREPRHPVAPFVTGLAARLIREATR